jgi:hypothetical protein
MFLEVRHVDGTNLTLYTGSSCVDPQNKCANVQKRLAVRQLSTYVGCAMMNSRMIRLLVASATHVTHLAIEAVREAFQASTKLALLTSPVSLKLPNATKPRRVAGGIDKVASSFFFADAEATQIVSGRKSSARNVHRPRKKAYVHSAPGRLRAWGRSGGQWRKLKS